MMEEGAADLRELVRLPVILFFPSAFGLTAGLFGWCAVVAPSFFICLFGRSAERPGFGKKNRTDVRF